MPVDLVPRPCPRCRRSIVLVRKAWGRSWMHIGTWLPLCEDVWIDSHPEGERQRMAPGTKSRVRPLGTPALGSGLDAA